MLNFEPVDRLPVIEWASWWHLTVERWRTEGLPPQLVDQGDIRDFLGLDPYRQIWVRTNKPGLPFKPGENAGAIDDEADYERIMPWLYPDPPFDPAPVLNWAERSRRGELVVWFTLDGFFWGPRRLLGIERHLYAFYDQAELLHRINRDLLAFNLRAIDALCKLVQPEFMTFAEDMAYNHGPMLSRELFDTFLAPYYRQIVPELKRRGIVVLVDSDGYMADMVPWLESVGIEGVLPWERMAGNDVAEIRRRHPRFRMIGGFDKLVMKQGDDAIRAEFERLLPVMRTGGFIPSVDHQTPPDVSLDQYRRYVAMLHEYARRACTQPLAT